jgi:hypothetical protein
LNLKLKFYQKEILPNYERPKPKKSRY